MGGRTTRSPARSAVVELAQYNACRGPGQVQRRFRLGLTQPGSAGLLAPRPCLRLPGLLILLVQKAEACRMQFRMAALAADPHGQAAGGTVFEYQSLRRTADVDVSDTPTAHRTRRGESQVGDNLL